MVNAASSAVKVTGRLAGAPVPSGVFAVATQESPKNSSDHGWVGQSGILQGLLPLLLSGIQGGGNRYGECRFVRGQSDGAAGRGADALERLRGGDAGKHDKQEVQVFHEMP